MFTVDSPVLVRVTVCDCGTPTVTKPKLTKSGLNTSCPSVDADPVPESERSGTAFEASLVTLTVAAKDPTASGANLTLSVALCPAAMVTGRLGDVREKYLVEIEALLIVTLSSPEFVAVIVRVLLLPAVTAPKARLPFPRESIPLGLPAALNPWQPARKLRPSNSNNALASFPGVI
jgi:hypothetical protein